SLRARRLAFLMIWGVAIYVAATHRGSLPRAQAYIRAASVPVVLAVLAMLLRCVDFNLLNRRTAWPIVLVAGFSLVIIQIVFYLAGSQIVTWATVMLLTLVGAALARGGVSLGRAASGQLAAIGVIALVASEMIFFYVDFGFVRRVGMIPASVQLMAIRF